jgi:hypothetical protein
MVEDFAASLPVWDDGHSDIQFACLAHSRQKRGLLMTPPLFSHKCYVRSALVYSRRHGGLCTDHRHYHVWQNLKETNATLRPSLLNSSTY